jgi:hypothetical protein
MDSEHLAHYHDSLSCFERTPASIERYRTTTAESLLKHLLDRHGVLFETVPDSWIMPSERKIGWRCGFCGGLLNTWKERGDHISIHFTREGKTMADWRVVVNVPKPVDERKSKSDDLKIKRLSVVVEVEGRDCGGEKDAGLCDMAEE